jgi:hypothetical protein
VLFLTHRRECSLLFVSPTLFWEPKRKADRQDSKLKKDSIECIYFSNQMVHLGSPHFIIEGCERKREGERMNERE